MLEYKINEFLTLKLEGGRTQIYIKGKRFLQCKRLVLNISKKNIPMYDEINSIDEAADLYKKHLYHNRIVEGVFPRFLHENHDITPEQEFWGHCSNIQAWYENDYDTRLLHSNLAFNLLKGLVDAGDHKAKRVFKTEVAERFESGYPNVVISIISARLLDYFSPEEKKELIQQNVPAVFVYFEKIVKNAPNIFPYIFKEEMLDYLELDEREQLTDIGYPFILDFMKKEGYIFDRRYKNIRANIEKDIFASLDQGQIKEIIHQNFITILEHVKKIWKYYPNFFLYFFEEKSFSLLFFMFSKEQITSLFQEHYPILINYFRRTSVENPDLFLSFFEMRLLNYLELKDKKQLIHQNYRIILNNIENLLKGYSELPVLLYPNPILDVFEEKLFDYLTPEEQKDLIQKNFLDLLLFIEKVSREYLRTWRPSKISKETVSYIYLVVLRAIKETPLIDDFLKKTVNSMELISSPIYLLFAMASAIKELKIIEATQQSSADNVTNNYWDSVYAEFRRKYREKKELYSQKYKKDPYFEAEFKPIIERHFKPMIERALLEKTYEKYPIDKKVKCFKCGKILPSKSYSILFVKKVVYCPYCGRLNRKE